MSSSKLQGFVKDLLTQMVGMEAFYENHRPDWMNFLELDFFIPDLNLALEIQGRQHFTYVPFFHGDYNGYIEQLNRDREKRGLCRKNNVHLLEIFDQQQATQVIKKHLPTSDIRYNEEEWFAECENFVAERIAPKYERRKRLRARRKQVQNSGRLVIELDNELHQIRKDIIDEMKLAICDFRRIYGYPLYTS